MYHLPVMKSETPTVIWVISGSSALSGRLGGDLLEDARRRPGTTKLDDHEHHDDREREDDRRIHHRRAHLAPQGVELLELGGDAVERALEAAGALAGAHHRAVERVEDAGLALHRGVQRAARLDVAAKRRRSPASASRPRSAPRACESERSIGMPEAISVANWREKTERFRMLTLLKRWKMLSSFNASRDSEMSRTIRPALAELLGDLGLRARLQLARARGRPLRRLP